jgi:hypothetical protein
MVTSFPLPDPSDVDAHLGRSVWMDKRDIRARRAPRSDGRHFSRLDDNPPRN